MQSRRFPVPAERMRVWAILALLITLAFLPVLLNPIPGLADLPNHIARHHVMFHHGSGGMLDHYFDVQWRWIGNLGVDLPVMLLMQWLDAETATRAAVSFIAPLTAAAILLLSRVAHGRISASAMLALPLVFHQAYMYGFVNYCLSVALALLVFAAYLARPPETVRGALLFALAALLVWTAHLGGWTVLLVVAGCAELVRVRGLRDIAASARRLLPLALPLVPLLMWRGASGGPVFSYSDQHLLWGKFMSFAAVLKGWSRYPDLAMTGAIGVLALLAFAWAGGRRADARLLAAGLGISFLSVIMPTKVLGSWGADFRLAPVGVILVLLSITPAAQPRRERLLFAAGALLFAVRVVGISASWHRAGTVLEQRLRILDDVPRGSRMGFIAVHSDCRTPWVLNPDRKLPGLVIPRRDAFTNTMFKVDGSDLMTIRDPGDRARWFDLSEDVEAVCPAGKVDQAALAERVRDMANDDFQTIWIWGVAADRIGLPPGYRVMEAKGNDVLIGRSTQHRPHQPGRS
ncbi:hypothetical protein [Sphingobium sp. DC-2]|uniref:hypothetical protein n=1 Tax=Sphingobium sp. DC-2 TaxID=1303256 RepID=UPI0004C2CFE6|nr:hypothetical protein [Sphingobium sp. DC-2]